MKLYIQNYSSYIYNDDINIKKELKQKYGLDTRRQDSFIHLALYGGMLLKDKTYIARDDELYVTSGVGNIDIVQKTNTYMYEENQPLKLFDFINLLGNTTSYYVAKALGIKGKNIFQISDNFTYINTLVSIYASLMNSGKNAIICSIDLAGKPDEITKRVSGVDEKQDVVSSVNYQKLSLSPKNAMAEIEFDIKSSTCEEIQTFYPKVAMISRENRSESFFETILSYKINEAIKNKQDMIFTESYKDRYKILKLKTRK